ncbi:MerR family transcriptional regulator [Clostridium felsineum]|uniref:HTH-type transcriptional regulator AdhR n=1 Tax=Clostridium felsineum TaxID=36839 RepID=A0A1S8LMB4_9CLOT|nr:MerR family transcriptional regulator [Clostridium felsineum]URZ05536.1 HTH-type transcriptional regulator AdhR [Clostridium felsineum]URZ10575.1 HTH-type transcriptional regulator AdhR [Clostridium felsineum]
MTISEVSHRYDISIDTLRYYEKIGLIPPVNRKSSGVRDYTEEDCNWVYFAKSMRNAGISIEALVEYVMLFSKGNETICLRKAILLEQREVLYNRAKEILHTLARLDKKIDGYEERVLKYEKKLNGL